ncbi:histidine-containing phosphotransfer protein 1 isoform X4 [Glycine max]|uniref:histidine-containing phosphotransfer protein 1 isoform X4 n=1 Tax=Glycine max TaxID=3847 RepID=UPI0007193615|nr:histidine-containing phosphotransfer protein 1 isoform X4 [Glycine max]|eukprot:XP_014627837.1 histidine-containing phosphotransfer protein 1 isoform X3 [Glycine max]
MDGIVQLERQLVDYTASLFHEGFLDDQFNQLQQLQDESNPDFVVEVVTLFFEDADRLLNELTKALGQPSIDFKRLDAHVHQLKGSSSRAYSGGYIPICLTSLFGLSTTIKSLINEVIGKCSIGAQRIHRVCISFRNTCEEQNVEGWSNRFWPQVDRFLGSVIRGRDVLLPL